MPWYAVVILIGAPCVLAGAALALVVNRVVTRIRGRASGYGRTLDFTPAAARGDLEQLRDARSGR